MWWCVCCKWCNWIIQICTTHICVGMSGAKVCLLQMMQLDNTNMYYPYLCLHLWCKGHSCDDLGTTLVCAGIFGAIDIAMWTLLGFVCWVQMMMVSKQTYPVVSTGVWCKQPDYDECTHLSYCLRGCVVHAMWLWCCMYRSVMLSALVCVVQAVGLWWCICTDLFCCLHWNVWCKQCDYHDIAVNPCWE